VSGFEVLPAIDVWAGRLARMRGGDPATLRAPPGDPATVARSFVDAGAQWIHVVDLDAALSGTPAKLDVVEMVAGLGVKVQAGGGLSADGVARALDRGAARAVLGSAGVSAWHDVADVIEAFGPRVALALDVAGERLRPRGRSDEGRQLAEVLADIRSLAPRPSLLVVTFVERDGSMAGVDVERLTAVARDASVPVLASGGVSSLDDLRALAAVGVATIAGAIVGRALADGVFTLHEALALAR